MITLQFAGVGSAFTTRDYYHSNVVVTGQSGKKLLIDCGSDARFSLGELGIVATDIDAVYISHLHADHVGGLEWLAFSNYFNPTTGRPKLFCNDSLMHDLWDQCLRGGLESIQGKVVTLTEYFDCKPVCNNDYFVWDGIHFTPIQTVHIMAGYYIKYSYGLIIREDLTSPTKCAHCDFVGGACPDHKWMDRANISHLGRQIFFTTDTQFCPNQINDFYRDASIIFQDCETAPYYSGVHAHYDDLKTLPDAVKNKMWLYHYQPNPPQNEYDGESHQYANDGFAGFVQKGHTFEFAHNNEAVKRKLCFTNDHNSVWVTSHPPT